MTGLEKKADDMIGKVAIGIVLSLGFFTGFLIGLLTTTISLCQYKHCSPYPQSIDSQKNS